ncbi:MAG: NAD-dependent epimerase/dehydratase family protein, partial [Longilinea sp.]|nr:NAD-dependent epimerase/dehydratase family protein [Longilinea sp.]
MILVTGGTGFIGQALARQLVLNGHRVRVLLRPAPQSPNLPRHIPVEVALCSLRDERGLRAAMKGVDAIFHLASAENASGRADLDEVDIGGAEA